MIKIFLILGSLNMFISVALGAFAAHGLKPKLTAEMLDVFQTGVQYHMVHALGLLSIGILSYWFSPSGWIQGAGWLLMIGILFFSGSLYLLSTTDMKWVGPITPLGGLAFLLGWVFLTIAVIKEV